MTLSACPMGVHLEIITWTTDERAVVASLQTVSLARRRRLLMEKAMCAKSGFLFTQSDLRSATQIVLFFLLMTLGFRMLSKT